jgi:hypothetical protein
VGQQKGNAEPRPVPVDPAVIAAIVAAVARLHPAARVTRIEAEE